MTPSRFAIFYICSAFTLGAFFTHAKCPVPTKDLTRSTLSGTVESGSGYKGKDKCTWEIHPPDDVNHYRLLINISSSQCGEKFLIEDTNYCPSRTSLLSFVENNSQNDCGNCPQGRSCHTFNGYPLRIWYQKDNEGFSLTYKFVSCTKTTATPTKSNFASTTKIYRTNLIVSTPVSSSQKTSPAEDTSTAKISEKSDTPAHVNSTQNNENTTAEESNPSTKETLETDSSTGMLVAIFVPLIIILVVVVVVLVIIVKMRKNKMKSESDSENNHSSTTGGSGFAVPNGVNTGVYASIDNHAAAPGTAFGNQAYQTVIGTQTRGSYAIVDDGAVYYSSVAGNGTQNGGLELPTNTYEQVTLDVEVNEYDHIASDTLRTQRNDYDEVALEERRPSEGAAIEVTNVLYGEN